MMLGNNKIFQLLRINLFAATIIFSLVACSNSTAQPSSTTTYNEVVVLTPYFTHTPTSTFSPALSTPTNTPLPPPTSTPFTHSVKKEETLLGIAFKYGVTLDELLAANPGVNIRFLSVGTVLVIPLNSDLASPTPTIPPPPLLVSEPVCFESTDNSLNCLALVKNPLDEAYEKLIFEYELYDSEGKLLSEQFAVTPLNRILPDSELPVSFSFSDLDKGSITTRYSTRLTLLSALPVAKTDEQASISYSYLDFSISDLQIKINDEGNAAHLSGVISTSQGTDSLWLVAVAYDKDQKPVGVRRLEIGGICPITTVGTLEPTPTSSSKTVCAEVPFELSVYSLGPIIDRVEILGEAHP